MASDPTTRWRAACGALSRRDYRQGWPLHEARRELPGFPIPRVRSACPEWRGEALAGKRLVVCGEQGFGDQIMLARYLPLLQAQGARVVFACHTVQLGRLFLSMGLEVAPLYEDEALPPADYWVLIGSVPHRLGDLPPQAADYLRLPASGGAGLGVRSHGAAAHARDSVRSLDPASAAELLQLGRDLDPAATGARDFLDTAAILAGLDLVITVDTAVAHLAGAMGKPCWVLLPHEGLDWRWNDGARSDWYPQARLFRQHTAGDWREVLGRVRAALEARKPTPAAAPKDRTPSPTAARPG